MGGIICQYLCTDQMMLSASFCINWKKISWFLPNEKQLLKQIAIISKMMLINNTKIHMSSSFLYIGRCALFWEETYIYFKIGMIEVVYN